MNEIPDNESESSLPTQAVPTILSSPPILTQNSSLLKMDQASAPKSEPSATQNTHTAQPLLRRVRSDETERPPSAQQPGSDTDEALDEDDEDEVNDEDADPAEQIAAFDWDDLHRRYHEAVDKCQDEEAELMHEWESLMTVLP